MSDWKDFGNYKKCVMCGRLLPLDQEQDCCESCEDRKLFRDMREYIRMHDVTEYKLAEIFKVPRSKVHSMIASGDVEYAGGVGKRSGATARCARCGAAISFGTYCAGCMRRENSEKKSGVMHTASNGMQKGRRRSQFSSDGKR